MTWTSASLLDKSILKNSTELTEHAFDLPILSDQPYVGHKFWFKCML